MRISNMITVLALLLPVLSAADIPSFLPEEVLECDGEKIDVGSYGAPLAVDWDGDGRKDLICGQFDQGRIRFYPNVGTDEVPVFMTWDYLMDGALPISVPYG